MKKYKDIWMYGIIAILAIVLATALTTINNQRASYAALESSYETLAQNYEISQEKIAQKEEQLNQRADIQGELNKVEQDFTNLQAAAEATGVLKLDNGVLVNGDANWQLTEKYGPDYSRIIDDLMIHPEIITREAVLGGTMFFERVNLLSDRLAFATFSDGHIMGSGIYEFYLDEAGTLQWQVIIEQLVGEEIPLEAKVEE